jgi:hypothetical protein
MLLSPLVLYISQYGVLAVSAALIGRVFHELAVRVPDVLVATRAPGEPFASA